MTLALDPNAGAIQPGTGSGGTVATTTGMTTSNSNNVLYCYVRTFGSGGQVATCASSTLGAWAQRATANDAGSHFTFAFFVIAPSALSSPEVVTVTFTSGTITVADMVVFAVSGANTVSPFDAGGPQTTGTSTPASMTTASPVTMVITGGESANGTWNVATPWTAIGATGTSLYNEYQLASTTGTFTGAITGDTIQCGSIDAIKAAGGAPPPSPFPSGLPRLIVLNMGDQ